MSYPKLSSFTGIVPLPQAPSDLVKEIQQILSLQGLYRGKVDGIPGAKTQEAFAKFKEAQYLDFPQLLGESTARALLESAKPKATSLSLSNDFASRIVRAMQSLGYVLFTNPAKVNIVYIEGMCPTGVPNADRMNQWNDLRIVLRFNASGVPTIVSMWLATTEPGWKYTTAPLNPGGAFRIAFGQYKAWKVGTHKDHEALVQCAEIKGHRDRNKDGFRTGDAVVQGAWFGVNQHWGYDMAQVNGASAGCLVGQTRNGHRDFMRLVKTDIDYLQNRDYVFTTAILDGSKL